MVHVVFGPTSISGPTNFWQNSTPLHSDTGHQKHRPPIRPSGVSMARASFGCGGGASTIRCLLRGLLVLHCKLHQVLSEKQPELSRTGELVDSGGWMWVVDEGGRHNEDSWGFWEGSNSSVSAVDSCGQKKNSEPCPNPKVSPCIVQTFLPPARSFYTC